MREVKQPKKSESKKRDKNPMFGKKHSLETRRKMRESAHRGGLSVENPKEYERQRYAKMTDEQKKKRAWSKNARNRAKRGNGGSHTFGEWEVLKAQYGWTCPCCKVKEPKISLTEDHIVPVSKGGSDNIENIQPLCRSCNCRKQAKVVKY